MSKALDKDFQKDYWEHNANARAYDHPVVEYFVRQRLDWIQEHIDLKKIKSAYDVGCGDGFATYYFDRIVAKVEGGDIAEYMLKRNPLPKEKLHVIDAEDLPLKDNSYELVYTWEVLHHVPHPQKAVDEMARVAKKYVIIFEPNRSSPLQFGFGLLNKQERGTLRSTKRYLEGLCKNAGLKIIASDFVGKIPPNKTPEKLLSLMKKIPFKSTALSGISIAIIAEKK
ncbi:MAG TPA: class I SAM-dependent methyltransferase [Candidatus Saccharimonadales bacterium]|nr:class I SAM-dependent methyltransferase [Candidatus Saccharimonadales bacterium]